MRVLVLILVGLMAACGETGAFVIVAPGAAGTDTEDGLLNDGSTDEADPPAEDDSADDDAGPADPGDEDDEDDTLPEDDDEDDASVPNTTADSCGVYIEPVEFGVIAPAQLTSGEVGLERSSGFDYDWRWSGCQATREFDRSGAFDCETVWNVTGEIAGGGPNAPDYVYRLDFEVNRRITTCPGATDMTWEYGFDASANAFDGVTLLEWSATGDGDWTPFAEVEYQVNNDFTQIEFDYVSEAAP
jgi:hypothetical protein